MVCGEGVWYVVWCMCLQCMCGVRVRVYVFEDVYVRVRVRVCERVCVRARARVCVRACVGGVVCVRVWCVCVRVLCKCV